MGLVGGDGRWGKGGGVSVECSRWWGSGWEWDCNAGNTASVMMVVVVVVLVGRGVCGGGGDGSEGGERACC